MRIHKEILTYRYEQKVHQLFKTIQFQSTKRVKVSVSADSGIMSVFRPADPTHTPASLRSLRVTAGNPRRLRTQRTNFFTLLTLLIFDKMLDLIH